MAKIQDVEIPLLKFTDRTTDPDTPVAGEGFVYVKDGVWHSKDAAGAVTEYGGGGGEARQSRIGALVEFTGLAFGDREAYISRVIPLRDVTLTKVRARVVTGTSWRLRIVELDSGVGNSTITVVLHETAFQAASPPVTLAWSGLSVDLDAEKFYGCIFEVATSTAQIPSLDNRNFQGNNDILSTSDRSGHIARDAGVSASMSEYASSMAGLWLDYVTR